MILIMDKDFRVVNRSKNLRGLLEYSRRVSKPVRIDLYKSSDGGQFGICWENGSSTICDFADFSIMEHFAHKKPFHGAEIKIHIKGENQ